MKKTFILLTIAVVFSACGGKKSGNGTETTDSTTTTTSTSVETTTVQDTLGKSLIAKNDCATCHREDQKIVGPAFDSVAYKYKSANPSIVDTLANKVIKGGSGNWGSVAMLAHPNLSMDDARHMVRYILSLKK